MENDNENDARQMIKLTAILSLFLAQIGHGKKKVPTNLADPFLREFGQKNIINWVKKVKMENFNVLKKWP
jgi:hypothetical protein